MNHEVPLAHAGYATVTLDQRNAVKQKAVEVIPGKLTKRRNPFSNPKGFRSEDQLQTATSGAEFLLVYNPKLLSFSTYGTLKNNLSEI